MRGSSLLIGVVVLVVGAIVAIDLSSPSTATSRPDPVAAGPAVGGAWYCAAGAVGENDELSVLTAAPATSSDPGDAEVAALHGQRTIVAEHPVFPGSARATAPGDELGEGSVGAAVRWWERPVVASRVWRRDVAEGVSGTVSGPCPSGPSPTWYVPGVSTAEGGTARLHLANPFPSDASVSITFTTPSGSREPVLLENVSVPSTSVQVVDLNEFIPRQADIGVAVETRAGRVVVEGVQELDAAIGGVEARALVPAVPELSETWTMAWSLGDPAVEDEGAGAGATQPTPAPTEGEPPDGAQAPVVSTPSPGNGTASWVWVSNPGTDPAAVTLVLHTTGGAVVPDIGDELVVDPGQVRRIDLRGVLPPGQTAAGMTLRSENGVPVAASTSTLFEPDAGDPGETGYTSQRGWARADASWVVPGEAAGARDQVLHVVNPGADDAVVDVALWNGSVLDRPPSLQDVAVPAGALVELDVTSFLAEASHSVAHVTASEGEVVVGRHSVSEDGGPDEWITHAGVPAGLWSGGETVPSVDHEPRLLERLGTSGGLQTRGPDDVGVTPTPGPAEPTPAPGPTTPSPTTPAPTGG